MNNYGDKSICDRCEEEQIPVQCSRYVIGWLCVGCWESVIN